MLESKEEERWQVEPDSVGGACSEVVRLVSASYACMVKNMGTR